MSVTTGVTTEIVCRSFVVPNTGDSLPNFTDGRASRTFCPVVGCDLQVMLFCNGYELNQVDDCDADDVPGSAVG